MIKKSMLPFLHKQADTPRSKHRFPVSKLANHKKHLLLTKNKVYAKGSKKFSVKCAFCYDAYYNTFKFSNYFGCQKIEIKPALFLHTEGNLQTETL